MNDIYENGSPKYSSACDIYEAIQIMASGEEIGILSEMFADVSWENQDYYYTDNAAKLEERWNELTDYGKNPWLMEIAVWQLSDDDANDWIYQILCNGDLAKRIGFKKLFTNIVLRGSRDLYDAVTDNFAEELLSLDYFDYYNNAAALRSAMEEAGIAVLNNSYSELYGEVYKKLHGLRLDEERRLIIESRALLTSYDDFMFGLRANQHLYKQQENDFSRRCARLKANYEYALRVLLSVAAAQGVTLELPENGRFILETDLPKLPEKDENENRTVHILRSKPSDAPYCHCGAKMDLKEESHDTEAE